MAEALEFTGWEAVGLRCPDHEIDLTDGASVAPISLIQMPNGTGKTTSLEMLRATMSGEARRWDADKVRAYRKKRPETETGHFVLNLRVGDTRATIKLRLDFMDGTVKYETTHGSGKKSGFHPPRGLRRFMTPSFVRFFIFDGELAEKLLDPQATDAEQVIEDLFQIRLLDTMQERIHGYWEEKTADQRVRNPDLLRKHRDKYERSKARLQTVRREKEKDEDRLCRLKEKCERKEKQFKEELDNQSALKDRLAKATSNFEQAQREIENTSQRVLRKMRTPHMLSQSFGEEIAALRGNLNRVRLPERTAREFFEELAEEEECVCGRSLNHEHREAIRMRADQYLGSEDMNFLNAMKRDISNAEASDEADREDLQKDFDYLIAAIDTEKEWQAKLDDIKAEGASENPRIAAVQEKVNNLKERIRDLETRMQRYGRRSEDQGIDDTWGLEILERRVERHQRKVNEIAETLDLQSKKETLSSICEDAASLAREAIEEEVCRQANNHVARLMPNNDIRIDNIDRSLQLHGQGTGSAGETLTVGYAFLSTLFHRSDYQLPFVVDSPANPIDLDIRGQVGRLVPQLANQFVAFTISSERQGFVTALRDEVEKNDQRIKYVTLFRKGIDEAEEQLAAEPPRRVQEFSDGWHVDGPAFFYDFQVDQEDE